MDLETATEGVRQAAGEDSGLNAKLTFDFGADGRISIDASRVPNEVSNDEIEADCTIVMSLDDFAELVRGELDGMTAFMTGRLKVVGDMGVALRLPTVLKH